MPANTLWTKWIVLSIAQWAKTSLAPEYLYVQGTTLEKDKPSERYELKYLGPDIISLQNNENMAHVIINCQICTNRTPSNIENHLIRIGKAQAMLAQCIPVYKYGSDPSTDDKTLFAQMQQRSNVETAILGAVDPVSNVERSTVEAAYKVVFEE